MADAIGTRFFPEIAAGGFSRVDGTVQFWQRVRALVRPESVVLDFGAGRGASQSEDSVEYRRNILSLKGGYASSSGRMSIRWSRPTRLSTARS